MTSEQFAELLSTSSSFSWPPIRNVPELERIESRFLEVELLFTFRSPPTRVSQLGSQDKSILARKSRFPSLGAFFEAHCTAFRSDWARPNLDRVRSVLNLVDRYLCNDRINGSFFLWRSLLGSLYG